MKKIIVASDLHGSGFYTKKLMAAAAREKAERMLLLGDLLYHGARNDLPKGYAPKEVIALLTNAPCPISDRLYGAIATVKLIKWSLLSLSWRIMPS